MDPNLTTAALDILMSTVAPDLDNETTTETLETTVRPADINPPIRKCNYFVIGHNNQTVVFDFSNQYGGTNYRFLMKLHELKTNLFHLTEKSRKFL